MASPTVLGVAALLKSHHPWFTKTQIDTLLLNHTTDVNVDNPSFAGLLGSGRVNANNSLSVLTTADYVLDTNFGFAPKTINFTDASPNAPSGPYEYDFGDGNTGAGPNAVHTYTEPGIYTIRYTGSGPSGPHTRIRPEQIVIVEDTVEYSDTTGLMVGDKVPISVRLRNTHALGDVTLPFRLTGPANVVIDSLTLTPLTANWDKLNVLTGSTVSAWRLRSYDTAAAIPPGGGIIANVWIRVVSGSSGEVEVVDSATLGLSQHTLRLITPYVNFKPKFVGGSATLGSSCDCTCNGDPICDGFPNAQDVVSIVNVAFRGGVDTVDGSCPHVGRSDMNCDCVVNAVDVVQVVNKAFRGDVTPPCDMCATPCF
jgi:PKD repeat protein